MGNKIEISVTQGLDVSNFFKDVPNFVKYIPYFVKDVPRGPNSVLKWGPTFNDFLRMFKGINGLWKGR